jgi:hypothetical protein
LCIKNFFFFGFIDFYNTPQVLPYSKNLLAKNLIELTFLLI